MENSDDKENLMAPENFESFKNIKIENSTVPEIIFEAGTIIRLKGLKGKKDYNGKFGVVKKELENGRFQVMIDGDKDLSMKTLNLVALNQCPNRQHRVEEGMLFWPHVKGCPTPCIQWLNDDVLEQVFVNPFGENSPFLSEPTLPKSTESDKSSEIIDDMKALTEGNLDRFRNYDRSWIDIESNFKSNHSKREQVMRKYETRLKELLNWSNPTPWIQTVTTEGSIENQVVVYYDADSKGQVNDWLNTRFRSLIIPEIRGAFVFIGCLHDKPHKGQQNTEKINYHKTIFHTSKYYGQPGTNNYVSQESREMMKWGSNLRKVLEKICAEFVCGDQNCLDCNRQNVNNELMMEHCESTGLSRTQVTESFAKLDKMMTLCDRRGIEYDDFMLDYSKKLAKVYPKDSFLREYVAKMEKTHNANSLDDDLKIFAMKDK